MDTVEKRRRIEIRKFRFIDTLGERKKEQIIMEGYFRVFN